MCSNRGYGEAESPSRCQVTKIMKVSFELLWRILLLLSRILDKAFFGIILDINPAEGYIGNMRILEQAILEFES